MKHAVVRSGVRTQQESHCSGRLFGAKHVDRNHKFFGGASNDTFARNGVREVVYGCEFRVVSGLCRASRGEQ